MKNIIFILTLVCCSLSAQKKEILIGAFSEMSINYDLQDDRFYNSDIGKSSEYLKVVWQGFKSKSSNGIITFFNDYVVVTYTLENDAVIQKEINTESFSDFQFLLNNFYKNNEPTLVKSETFNRYRYVENDNIVLFATSFFTLGNAKKPYENDYVFGIIFKKEGIR